MSGMLLPELRHSSPRWLNLLDRAIGRHEGNYEKGTWMRSLCPGCSQWFYKSDKRLGTTPISPDRLLMHLGGLDNSRSWQVYFEGQGRALGDRVCDLKSDVE